MINQVPAAELLAQFQENEKLQDKLKAVATPDGQIAINDAISIAKEAGFEISASDLAVKEDLTEEQLEAVTGGNNAGLFGLIAYGVAAPLTQGLSLAMDAEDGFSLFRALNHELHK